jgi:hypothetical protein
LFKVEQNVNQPVETFIRQGIQRAIDPVWRVVAQGCRLVRDTRAALEQAGFDTTEVADWRLPGGGITGPALLGTAYPRD